MALGLKVPDPVDDVIHNILPRYAKQATEFPLDPQNYKGKIIEVTGISFYIDSDGIAHWIATTADWMCATWDLGATRVVVPGYLLGSFVFGDVFDCPTR